MPPALPDGAQPHVAPAAPPGAELPGSPGPVAQPAPRPWAARRPAPEPAGVAGMGTCPSRPARLSLLTIFFMLRPSSFPSLTIHTNILYREGGIFQSFLLLPPSPPPFLGLPLSPLLPSLLFPCPSPPPPPLVCPNARPIIAVYEVLTGLCQAALSKQSGVTD